ncbi:hypothetical protein PR048_024738 [Dryococelus australis]|uniref:Uncharacterized protein n=1 Tax=Dryococelus australis TaxID=614101 RepID=A0ABQ9GPD8_9NEOP|nr:hypothetical protein PR048_024738 [Dryococelus australis]
MLPVPGRRSHSLGDAQVVMVDVVRNAATTDPYLLASCIRYWWTQAYPSPPPNFSCRDMSLEGAQRRPSSASSLSRDETVLPAGSERIFDLKTSHEHGDDCGYHLAPAVAAADVLLSIEQHEEEYPGRIRASEKVDVTLNGLYIVPRGGVVVFVVEPASGAIFHISGLLPSRSYEPIRVKRGEYEAPPECKDRGNERYPRKPTEKYEVNGNAFSVVRESQDAYRCSLSGFSQRWQYCGSEIGRHCTQPERRESVNYDDKRPSYFTLSRRRERRTRRAAAGTRKAAVWTYAMARHSSLRDDSCKSSTLADVVWKAFPIWRRRATYNDTACFPMKRQVRTLRLPRPIVWYVKDYKRVPRPMSLIMEGFNRYLESPAVLRFYVLLHSRVESFVRIETVIKVFISRESILGVILKMLLTACVAMLWHFLGDADLFQCRLWLVLPDNLEAPSFPIYNANRAQFPAGSLLDFCTSESRWTMPLVVGFSRGSPVSPRPPIPALLHIHLASLSSALKSSDSHKGSLTMAQQRRLGRPDLGAAASISQT